jgi:flagellar biosynthesis protein
MTRHNGGMGETAAERRYDLTKSAIAVTGEAGRQAVVRAKGRGAVAEHILDLAFEHGVKVREDAALTQLLEAVELDSPIPLPALNAVCEILTRVYQATAGPAPEAS